MPEPTLNGTPTTPANGANGEHDAVPSTPLEMLKAVKEVQERRISVWREYDDAFDTFLNSDTAASNSASNGPVNGSLNNAHASDRHRAEPTSEAAGQRCAGCSTSTVPLSADLLAQILQITTQALIECGHRLRAIQTELAHSEAPALAQLVDRIQTKENALLRNVVQRDQLRKTTLRPTEDEEARDDEAAKHTIAQLDASVKTTRAEIAELMQEVYAESVELQLAQG